MAVYREKGRDIWDNLRGCQSKVGLYLYCPGLRNVSKVDPPKPLQALPLPPLLVTMHRSLRSRFRNISPRDAILILLGAASMHLYSSFLPHVHESSSMNLNTHLIPQQPLPNIPRPAPTALDSWHPPQPRTPSPPSPQSPIPNLEHEIPQTELVSHAPGWTIFRNLYMADGTLFIVTSDPESFPSIDLITSTGLPALATQESIAERMPTDREMAVITPQEAHQRWGGQSMMELNNIFPVEGSTVRPHTLPFGSSLTFESR